MIRIAKNVLLVMMRLTMVVWLVLFPGIMKVMAAPLTHEHDNLTFSEWTGTNSLPDSAGNYYLSSDVELSGAAWTVPSGTVNLCLNGHYIKQTTNGKSVININSGSTLYIYDDGTETVYYSLGNNVPATISNTQTDYSFTGGYITGGNTTTSDKGCIQVNGGIFKLYKGTLVGNQGKYGASAVYVKSAGTFEMTGGKIVGNYCSNSSSVFAENGNSKIIMSGGVIENNKGNACGGVQIDQSGEFQLSGGKIINNIANGSEDRVHGGGVLVSSSGTFKLSGNPVVSGNIEKKFDSICDVGFASNKKITIIGALTEGAHIGIYNGHIGTNQFTTNYSTYNSGVDPSGFFFSDVTGYSAVKNANNEVEIRLNPVKYLDWNGTTLVEKTGDDACSNYNVVSGGTFTSKQSWGAENTVSWYVVKEDTNMNFTGDNGAITVAGEVHLIICDGKTLTISSEGINSGINVYYNENNSSIPSGLIIHGQSEKTGRFEITSPSNGIYFGQTSPNKTFFTINGVSGTATTSATNAAKALSLGGPVTIREGELALSGVGAEYGAVGAGKLYVGNNTIVYTDDSQMPDVSDMEPLEVKTDSDGTYVSPRGAKYVLITQRLHEHSFTYTAGTGDDANKITAVCSADDCPIPLTNNQHTATLTIEAPVHTNYGDGKDAAAVITDTYHIQGSAEVKYYATENGQKTGSALSSAPENVGIYWAEITLGTGNGAATAHVLYTIDKAAPSALEVSEARTSSGIDYTLETVSPSDGYEISSSNTEYSAVTSLTSILDGNDSPVIYVRRAETTTTAAGEWVAVILTARPSAPSITVASYAESNSAKGTVTGVATTMEYKSDSDTVTTWTPVTSADSMTLDPGTYLFRKKATDSAPAGITASVTVGVKSDIELTDAPADDSTIYLKYTGNELTLLSIDLPSTYDGCTVRYSADGSTWDTSPLTATNEGTYQVYYKIDGGVEYNNIPSRHATVIISSRIALDESSTTLTIKKDDTAIGTTAPVVGDTLTADCSATDLIYQWCRDGEAISGATESTYTLTKDDYGSAITVIVTQTKDLAGNEIAEDQRNSLTSSETVAVTAPVTIGDKGYLDIASALTDVTGGKTIVLHENITSDVNISNGADVTLDLNGWTLTGNITNSGSLIIKDSNDNSGKLTGTIQTLGGETVIESGKFENVPDDVQDNGSVRIKGGYFKQSVSSTMLASEDYEIEEYSSGGTFTPSWADTDYGFRVVEISSYTVVFDANGGKGTMSDQTVSRGVETKLNANKFSKEGYVFAKWNTKQDGSGTSYEDKAEITLTANITLYAQWEKSNDHNHLPLKEVEAEDPGCETEGNKHYYECDICGKIFEDPMGQVELTKESVIIKATGHKWDDGVITKEATYDETGIKTFTCENDSSHIREEEIPVKTRSEQDNSKKHDSSDSDSSGSSGSSGSSSYKSSSSTNAEIQAKVDQINNGTSFVIPENHQAESGLPVSDAGGNWDNNADNWTYTKSDGSFAVGEWMNLDYNGLRYWYYFDNNGIMQTNWFDYNNERFYLMPEKDGWRGRMATGWKNIDNKWYYFETVPGSLQGKLYRSTVTPDGHTVGADGSWDGVGATPIGQE